MIDFRWIWQAASWPQLSFDTARLAQPLARARQEVGVLVGKAATLGLEERHRLERDIWSGEAAATAALEGETVDLEAVRSSVARRLGVAGVRVASGRTAASSHVEGLLDVMENAAGHWREPLTRLRLCAWHAALFPDGRSSRHIVVGDYRSSAHPLQVVSGPRGRETIHYEAVAGAAVRAEMHAFLEWFNSAASMDGLLRAALANVWFESIRPFEAGNGRIGRAIMDLAVAQDLPGSSRLLGISAAMRNSQESYHDALNRVQRGDGDVTTWLSWFLDSTVEACRTRTVQIEASLARARFWAAHRAVALNTMQRRALDWLLDAGPGRFKGGLTARTLTARMYRALSGTTKVTASRHLTDLVEKGLIVRAQGRGGRSIRYELALHVGALHDVAPSDVLLAGWAWPAAAKERPRQSLGLPGPE